MAEDGSWSEPGRQLLQLAQKSGIELTGLRCWDGQGRLLAVVGSVPAGSEREAGTAVEGGWLEWWPPAAAAGRERLLGQLFDQLRRERMRQLLVSGLAHELKNSLTILNGRLELLLKTECREWRQGLAAARYEAERLTLGLEELLAGAAPVVRQEVDLPAVVEACRQRLEPLIPAGVAVAVVPPAAPERLRLGSDRRKVEKILGNLILNALQTAGVRRVEIRMEHTGDAIEVTVCDDGQGVAPPVRARLFEPFVTSKPGGHGLGLAVCRILADQLGAQIGYREGVPRGACFWLRLPAEAV